MSKRSRSRQDVFPQTLTVGTGNGSANDYNVVQFALPISRLGGSASRAAVLEIIRVDYYLGIRDIEDLAGNTFLAYLTPSPTHQGADTATLTSIEDDCKSTINIAPVLRSFQTTTSGASTLEMPLSYDLTDGAGNGFLVASDQLTLVSANVGGTTASSTVVKVWYRLVNVGMIEYVGILQSQGITKINS